ncbi:DNA-binding transcriptional regulator, FadR family [Sphingobium faniae]|nr:DNA-binding transcriptional regulator, FadR family [Sphingobium faniae]
MADTSPRATPQSLPERQKRADQIASELEAQILAGLWPAGHRIGNESELARNYTVSRWTMREAIAILEQAGSVVARRGSNGGLYVAARAQDLVRNNLGAYLELAQIPFSAIMETRLALSMAMAGRAIGRMRDRDRVQLAGLILASESTGLQSIEAMSQARILLRDLAGNGPMSLFLAALSDVGMHSCWMSSLDDETFIGMIDKLTAATRKHCLAVVAENLDVARAAEMEVLEITQELHNASSASGRFRSTPNAIERAYAIYPSARPAKKAERIAWAIRQRINDERLQPGAIIGSEDYLMHEHKVGRPVLREAIRMLERLGAVEMRRGGASGLTVIAPNPSRIIDLARGHLRRDPPSEEELLATIATLKQLDPHNPVARLMLTIIEG